MTREELQNKITELQPKAIFEEGGEWLNVQLEFSDWLEAARMFRNTKGFDFDYLLCLTCVDWKTHLTMVYHLESTIHRHTIVVKCKLERTNAKIESVANIWRTAEFHEREVFELFGVDFLNHPDLRLLILPDGWEGRSPLRKDFEDEINMIKL